MLEVLSGALGVLRLGLHPTRMPLIYYSDSAVLSKKAVTAKSPFRDKLKNK